MFYQDLLDKEEALQKISSNNVQINGNCQPCETYFHPWVVCIVSEGALK